MQIEYSYGHEFNCGDLEELFCSVGWESGKYPEKLVEAMKNYKTVISAWDGEKLVGLMSAMDDGIMTAYVHYLLVNPEYQGANIGRTLMELTKEHYKDYVSIVLSAYTDKTGFYEKLGFKQTNDAVPMKMALL
ncbi:MAG: GNAT family N-acetyltransferase [Candidatus Coproplasma sp.]